MRKTDIIYKRSLSFLVQYYDMDLRLPYINACIQSTQLFPDPVKFTYEACVIRIVRITLARENE